VYASGLAIIDVEELLEDMDAVGRGMVAANGRETQEGGERERERESHLAWKGVGGEEGGREGGRERRRGTCPCVCVWSLSLSDKWRAGGRKSECVKMIDEE
jgi:hypothetical protein